MKVNEILQSKGNQVYTLDRHSLMKDAVKLLSKRNIGVVVVMEDDGAVSGILSERDVVHSLAEKSGDAVLDQNVGNFMTTKLVTCTPQTEIADVMSVMTKKRIRHMPVLEADRLVGLVSIGDVVKRKISETEEEAEALKQYIAAG